MMQRKHTADWKVTLSKVLKRKNDERKSRRRIKEGI